MFRFVPVFEMKLFIGHLPCFLHCPFLILFSLYLLIRDQRSMSLLKRFAGQSVRSLGGRRSACLPARYCSLRIRFRFNKWVPTLCCLLANVFFSRLQPEHPSRLESKAPGHVNADKGSRFENYCLNFLHLNETSFIDLKVKGNW